VTSAGVNDIRAASNFHTPARLFHTMPTTALFGKGLMLSVRGPQHHPSPRSPVWSRVPRLASGSRRPADCLWSAILSPAARPFTVSTPLTLLSLCCCAVQGACFAVLALVGLWMNHHCETLYNTSYTSGLSIPYTSTPKSVGLFVRTGIPIGLFGIAAGKMAQSAAASLVCPASAGPVSHHRVHCVCRLVQVRPTRMANRTHIAAGHQNDCWLAGIFDR
jgi:hypothetical protein